MRFIYEFFLEFSICICLQLSVKDFSTFSPTLQFWLSVAVTVVMIALIAFIFSLCFFNGPWVGGFYARGTASGSLVGTRPINPDFDKEKYLQQHPIPKVKPWGHFIINLDCDKFKRCGRKGKGDDFEDASNVQENAAGPNKLYNELDSGATINPLNLFQ